jgi:hypothetical protein
MQTFIDERVTMLDRELLRRHRHDQPLFDELIAFQQASGILHGDRPISPFLRPYFLAESRYNAIRTAAASIYRAIAIVTTAALEYKEIMKELGVTEKEERWARLDPGYSDTVVTSRLDTFLSPDCFAFLEYNGENPAGIGDQPALQKLFQHVPAVRSFLEITSHYFPQPHTRLLASLDHAYREYGGKKEKPNIAIVDWAGVSTGAEFGILQEVFETAGYRTGIFVPDDLDHKDGVLRAGDFEIDVFYKRVIIHEFLERFDENHPLFTACSDGVVCMANSFRSKIPHKKSCFAILTDERYKELFDTKCLDVINRHVPWTRIVRHGETTYRGKSVDLIKHIRVNRHKLVLKPNDDYGGKGIYIGWESSESEWDDAIEVALLSPYIVQERVPVEKTDIPAYADGEAKMASLNVDFDPFLFQGVVEGGMVRLAASSIVNISQGGGETSLAILKGV